MSVTRFELPGFRGEAASALAGVDLPAAARRLLDPAAALATIHWGRNYLYRARLDVAANPIDVVVKQFRNESLVARWRRRFGSGKAERAWRMGRALAEAGIPTAEPLLYLDALAPAGPALVVTRFVPEATELRFLLRARNAGREREEFPALDFDATLAAIAQLARRLHGAGFLHRDFSVGNLLLVPSTDRKDPVRIVLVDVNRCRRKVRPPSLFARMREFSRLPLRRAGDRRRLLDLYFEGPAPFAARLADGVARAAFVARAAPKERLRGALRATKAWLLPRRAHTHIPAPPPGAGRRDRIVWDRLSDQPHQHAGRLARFAIRLADLPDHTRSAAAALGAAPRILGRARALARTLPVATPWPGAGVAIRAGDEDPAPLLAAVGELGLRRVLLRVHLWEEEALAATVRIASELAGRGVELTFAVAQNRDLVRDRVRFRAAIERAGRELVPFGRRFQIGQAINRSKWGFWSHGDYLELANEAAAILRAAGEVELAGPAVIDFEPYAWAAVLNRRAAPVFDAVAALLYVDRRGAPENRQLGFDTVGKLRLLRSVAETSPAVRAPRLWITEVNWPLREGPHSPAGRAVAVDEETQADYLVRYFVAAFSTGWVERIFWWQLAAKGYGLLDPTGDGSLRRRPAFHALATLEGELADASALGRLAGPETARLYHFRSESRGETVVAWSLAKRMRIALPRAPREIVERDGGRGPAPGKGAVEVELTPSPRYFRLG